MKLHDILTEKMKQGKKTIVGVKVKQPASNLTSALAAEKKAKDALELSAKAVSEWKTRLRLSRYKTTFEGTQKAEDDYAEKLKEYKSAVSLRKKIKKAETTENKLQEAFRRTEPYTGPKSNTKEKSDLEFAKEEFDKAAAEYSAIKRNHIRQKTPASLLALHGAEKRVNAALRNKNNAEKKVKKF